MPADRPLTGTSADWLRHARTVYAVMSRYPGEYEPITEDEYCEALRIAESVLLWAENSVSNRP